MPFSPAVLADNATARLAGLLESAMDAIITVDGQQRIVMYNRAAEHIFGWPADRVIGQPLAQLLPGRFREAHAQHVERFGRTGITSRRMGGRSVVRGLHADGHEFPVDASISQIDTADGGKLYTVILRDVTERERARHELATLAAEAHTAREQEKTRVARELHDELAQSLTALKMDATGVAEQLTVHPEAARRKLAEMVTMIDAAVAATRRISADLRPLVLDDLGLGAAIEWLAQNFTQRTGVPCALDVDPLLELGEPHASAVFRLVQESLTNVAKHANASKVEVGVRPHDGELVLWVHDDGLGYDTRAPRKPNSMGVAGLRERARLLRGKLSIDSAPGAGARVRVVLPMPGVASGEEAEDIA